MTPDNGMSPHRHPQYLKTNKYDDVIKWKSFTRYWPFPRGIHRSPVNSPHKGQWRGALMVSLMYSWINGWVNSREAGDLRRHRAHYDATVMKYERNDDSSQTLLLQNSILTLVTLMSQWSGTPLVHVIACRLFCTKLVPEVWDHISVKSKYHTYLIYGIQNSVFKIPACSFKSQYVKPSRADARGLFY